MTEPIQVTSHVARDFLQNAAYFNTVPKVVWEYVSNAVDNPRRGQSVTVQVVIDKRRIVVKDDGCGMSRGDLNNYFQMHATNVRRRRGETVRGRYGTGKCAAFGIANALRVETVKDGSLNTVELTRDDIKQAESGQPFSVRDIIVDRTTVQESGTTVMISGLNVRSLDLTGTVAYVERHLGRLLTSHTVLVNDHVCEYAEPPFSWERRFAPDESLSRVIGEVELAVRVSPSPLDKERVGIDILSKGVWHETYVGDLDGDIARRLFGSVDVPILEDRYEDEEIPPFDNTRNMTLNLSNPIVVSLLGWIRNCLNDVATQLAAEERSRKATEEARKLERQARDLAKVLNEDFRSQQIEIDRARRLGLSIGHNGIDEGVPGVGDTPVEYTSGGAEHGDGRRGEVAGPGEVPRPGPGLLDGHDIGETGRVVQSRQARSTFHVELKHEAEQTPRSRYDGESRTIVINLDHPQIAAALREAGGIEGRQFKQMTREVALVEYAVALCHERLRRDEFYSGSDALFDMRHTINRVSRIISKDLD